MSSTPVLHVDERGSGPALVLSHGVGGDTSVWHTMTPPLAASFHVVAWDQPGHGQSIAVADDAYGPRLAYSALSSIADRFDKVVLLGHSLGGYLSARYAIEHPDRVTALVLLATGPGFRSPDAMAKWNDDVRRGAAKVAQPQNLVGLHEDAFVIDHLGDIRCPTLAMVGSLDTAFLGATDYIEKKIPGVERITIDEADHMMPAFRGTELAALVLDFLARRLGS